MDSGDSCQAGQQCPATRKYSFTIQLDVYKCLEIVNVAGKLNFVMQSNMKTWWQTILIHTLAKLRKLEWSLKGKVTLAELIVGKKLIWSE